MYFLLINQTNQSRLICQVFACAWTIILLMPEKCNVKMFFCAKASLNEIDMEGTGGKWYDLRNWSDNFFLFIYITVQWRVGLVQAVESYRLWSEGPGFESRSPRIAQARVRLATDTLPQTLHRAGALCTGYALFFNTLQSNSTFNF